jgi:membrane protein
VLERLGERFGWLRTPVAVHRRVGDVGGGPLASSIALAAFLSLFPLLLVGISVVGFVAANDTGFVDDVIEQFGLTGSAADLVSDVVSNAQDSRRTASLIGVAGLLWAALGIVGTLAQAFDATWQVKSPPGWKAKLVHLASLAGAALLFVASTALGPVAAGLPGPAAVPAAFGGLVLDVVLLLWLFRMLTNVTVPWRDHLPGALAGGVALGALKLVGTVYLPRAVASSSALYGSIGVVFAILAWLAIAGRVFVYASAFNVVRHEEEHGTDTVTIEVPHIAGEVPVEATRGGAVAETEQTEATAEVTEEAEGAEGADAEAGAGESPESVTPGA